MNAYGAVLHWYRKGKLEYLENNLYTLGCKWMNVYVAVVDDTERGKLK